MKVQEIMTTDPACCTSQTLLSEVVRLMIDNDCGQIPIVDNMNDKSPIGVITDRDVACRAFIAGKDPRSMTVSECMTDPCISVSQDTTLDECCRVLETNQIRRVPVVDKKGALCGIVSQADIALKGDESRTADVVREISEPRSVHHATA